MVNHNAAKDALNEYLRSSTRTSTLWSYNGYQPNVTISPTWNDFIYGNWIVSDDTDNPLEPIGIDEII